MSDKQRIARTFASAASDYDAHAVVQRHAAQQLALRAQAQWPRLPAAARMLEIGCGTGNLSTLLLQTYPAAELLATDLAPAMVEACRQRLFARGRQPNQPRNACASPWQTANNSTPTRPIWWHPAWCSSGLPTRQPPCCA